MAGFSTLKQEGYPLTAGEVAVIDALATLGDPGADRILFWDESENAYAYLTAGTGLTITGTTIAASGAGATTALDNLASVAINTSLISDTDSTDDLGSSAKYWANVYADKLYLNATATLDGAVAGAIGITGNQDIIGNNYIKWLDATRTTTYAYLQANNTNTIISAVNTPLSLQYGALGSLIGASLDTAGNWIFNYAAGDCDFTINKLTAGAAYTYDAGADTSTFGSAIIGLSSLTLGTVGTATGSVVLKGTTSGVVTLKTADAAGTYTLTLPTDDGGVGQFLQTDGSGVLTWADGGAAGASTALDNLASVAINTTLVSDTDNTDALGTTAIAWSDLFLGNGAVITFNSSPSTADVTITHSANLLTIGGGDLALGANSITITGSIADTTNRVTKGWFTDLEVTNAIAGSVTGNAGTVTNATLTTALTVNTGTVTLTGNVANSSVLTIGAGAVSVSGDNTGDQDLTGYLLKSAYNAHTVLYATTDDTPAALEVTEQTLVGRLTGGNISAVAIGIADNNVIQIDAADVADNDYAKFTANGVEGKSYSEVLSDISGAKNDLSNLASVAVNTSIISDTDNTDDLGSADKAWKDVYARTIKLDGATSGTVTIDAAAEAGTWSLTLPVNDGDANQVLTTDGSGNTSWTTPSGGGFSSKARAFRDTSAQTITKSSATKIEFNAETYDVDGEFDSTTNYRFTATSAGYYLVNLNISYDSSEDQKYYAGYIRVNNSNVAQGNAVASGTGGIILNVSDIRYLAANDYVEGWTFHNSAADKDVSRYSEQTFISIHRLS